MNYDYVLVGAGPANLIAANRLLSAGDRRIALLDTGNPLYRRRCPCMNSALCSGCSGEHCLVTEGVGGTSAIYGNKLCYFPASSAVLTYFEPEMLASCEKYINNALNIKLEITSRLDRCSRTKKAYSSEILYREDYGAFLEQLLFPIQRSRVIRANTCVSDIIRLKDGTFTVLTSSGDILHSANVVLGTGRSSHAFLRRLFSSVGISYRESCQDIGIRIEAMSRLFTEEYSYQEDPKFKFDHGSAGSTRTFCACNGGIVVPVRFVSGFYAEGAFCDQKTDMNNIALMARSRRPIPAGELAEWCMALNKATGNSLFLGEISLNVANGRVLAERILELVPYWPSHEHEVLMYELLSKTLEDPYKILKLGGGSVKVYGPALDRYWPAPRLLQGLTTEVPGLFVLGDAAGASRGIVQALVSGAAWAATQESASRHTLRGGALPTRSSVLWSASA